jgi:hypothetical protein
LYIFLSVFDRGEIKKKLQESVQKQHSSTHHNRPNNNNFGGHFIFPLKQMQEPQISDAHLASLVSRYLTSNGFYKAAAAFKEDAKHLFAAPNPRLAVNSFHSL